MKTNTDLTYQNGGSDGCRNPAVAIDVGNPWSLWEQRPKGEKGEKEENEERAPLALWNPNLVVEGGQMPSIEGFWGGDEP